MNFSFGICTEYDDLPRLYDIIHSIEELDIPNCEILLVGGNTNRPDISSEKLPILQFEHSGWITEKKNFIAAASLYENLVVFHDYFKFDPLWFRAYLKFGYEWDICSNPQYLIDGNRHATDWIMWDHPDYPKYHSFDYKDWTKTKYQYISGGYFLVKRSFLEANPFNETLTPGDPEDVEWSLRVRGKAKIVCNPNAIVRHNKIHRDVGNKSFPLYSHVSYLRNNK